MAKKVSKKKSAAAKGGLSSTVRARASAVINEVEKAGEVVLAEVKGGLGAVTDKIAATAKNVTEIQAAQILKTLVAEVEEIGGDMVDAVSRKMDQLRGKVAAETKTAATGPKKKAAAKKKAAPKKKVASKKKAAAKKKVAAKKKAATKKKPTTTKKVAKKKVAAKKKTGASKKVTAKKKAGTGKKVATRKKSAPRKKAAARK